MNKEKRKERICPEGCGHRYPCSRNAVKDGYCKQHHPDTVKARREKAERKYEENLYIASRRIALRFVNTATEEDLKLLSKAINKKLK